jgi:2,4-dienoyl-CoA reductase (NADPH2)
MTKVSDVRKHATFHLNSLDLLREELAGLELELPVAEDLSILGEPVSLGQKWRTPNRFVALPMEGFDSSADGSPGELSFRRYRRFAQGGTGLLWFEATAILHEARSNPHQLYLHEKNVDVYARLVEATRKAARDAFGHEIIMVMQLTHSGRYCKPSGAPSPMIAHHSAVLDPLHKLDDDYPLVTDEYLDRLQDTYVEASKLAARAGFDGVDIKSCHRYLISELLASHTRDGRYGGSLKNRSRMLREVMGRVADEIPDFIVTTRMNVYDAIAYPYGFGVDRSDPETPDLSDPLELIGQLQGSGLPLINATIGNPYFNPHYGRPYDRAVWGGHVPNEHPLAGVARFVGITRQIQEALPQLPVVAGGYTWLRHLMPYVAAGAISSGGATLIGQGRGMFAYPDSARDILTKGRMDPAKTCVTCSGCTQIMRDGTMTGCVVRDSEIYGPQYRLGRRFAMDNLQEQARRCRDCESPTCTAGCPARVDVPAFVTAFADGRIQDAYEVLRRSNALPEMCAMVCPTEEQCEGGCIEGIFTRCPIPIADIQLVVSRIARREGITGVRLPKSPSGRSVAVVGGGPAGIACAAGLLEKGHSVTVIEKSERLGGTPDCVIPGARYEDAREEIDAILQPAKDNDRVTIRTACTLGRDVSLDQLQKDHDAVFLAVGLGGSTSLGQAEGVVEGVVDALTFLGDAKRGRIKTIGDRVAILGGGNTAVDAAVTARRLGARDVYVVYRRSLSEMPAWAAERDELLRCGCHLLILTAPLSYETDANGKLVKLRMARTELGAADESGRRRPIVVPGSESSMDVDLVVEALGQRLSADLRESLGGIEVNDRGLVATGLAATGNDSRATSISGVFAGGDLTNGGTTAVQGIADGMRAADEIDEFLASGTVVSA